MDRDIPKLFNQLERLYRKFSRSDLFFNKRRLTLPEITILEFILESGQCHMKDIIDELFSD